VLKFGVTRSLAFWDYRATQQGQ